jgi:hypothetical protein
MAVTNFSPLLGFALPTTGDLSGTWGTTVNDSITGLIDSAVAGTATLSTDANVTLTTTNGSANQARQAILLCTGARTTLKTITAPAQSKAYVVINATTGGFGIKVVGAGPTTGVTIANGEKALIAWNGSDFVVVAVSIIDLTAGVKGILPVVNGGTGVSTSTGTGNTVLSASPTFTGVPLAPTAATNTNTTQLATTAFVQSQIGASAVTTFSAGTTGFTPSTATGGAVTLSGTLVTANGGTGNANGTVAKLATTNFSIEESGGNLIFKYGATTIASMTSAGVFTTLSDITSNGTP